MTRTAKHEVKGAFTKDVRPTPRGGVRKIRTKPDLEGGGGFEVFGCPKLEKLYSLFSRYFCWKSYLRTKVFVTWQL